MRVKYAVADGYPQIIEVAYLHAEATAGISNCVDLYFKAAIPGLPDIFVEKLSIFAYYSIVDDLYKVGVTDIKDYSNKTKEIFNVME